MKKRRFFIRWRKSSATWVIYEGRNTIIESGFDSPEGARDYLNDLFPNEQFEAKDEEWKGNK